MGRLRNICTALAALIVVAACAPESDSEMVNRYTCNCEGEACDALVDDSLNSDKIAGGVKTYTW
jgi:hypothetical protein